MVHLLGIRFVGPMREKLFRVTKGQSLKSGMNLEGKGTPPQTVRASRFSHDSREAGRSEHQRCRSLALPVECEWHLSQKAKMIRNSERTEGGEGMTIVQMEMEWFPEIAKIRNQIQNCRHCGGNGRLHVSNEFRKSGVLSFQATYVFPCVRFRIAFPYLPNSNMPDIDASAQPIQLHDRMEKLRKRARLQSRSVLDKEEWTTRDRLQASLHIPSSVE